MTEASEPRILIVDDARDIREPLGQYLRRNGFRTCLAADAAEARLALGRESVHLIVLDVMMPGEDGLSLCADLARSRRVPVILLTARAAQGDRVAGLELGADDYVTKPFDPRELLARIRAVLRRVPPALPGPGTRRRRFAGLVHDPGRAEVTLASGQRVALTSGENRLLGLLLDHPGQVLSRMRLLDLLAGREARAYDRAVDNIVSRLRHKIEENPRAPRLIVTEWGGGYRLAADEVEELA
ncbi:response regulator transcription factor [Paracoccus sp. PS-1]|uniref:response regulator n=1 Tax=unclassified Paracoccus (in: a-proteobacteria) TaxID=2688777 RepID=UPI000491A729|nr:MULTISPECIES: response regulator transcription factor [unclassified Paracoccus (in: a-proteobacteria)]MDQ7261538.1 response regulator transcription factor [Paracoccus sp. PS1]